MKYQLTHTYPLRQKMKKHGYTIRKLAEATGVHFTTISRLLSEKTVANEETYQKISNYFKSL